MLLSYNLYQYEKCFGIFDKYIACVRLMNDDPALMSTAGDGVVLFMYNDSLSLY